MMKNLLVILPLLLLSCGQEPNFSHDSEPYISVIDTIEFDLHNTGIDSLFYFQSVRSNRDSYVIYNPTAEKFFRFDRQYNYLNNFGSKGPGPGEFQTFTVSHYGVNDELYLYDLSASKIVRYSNSPPDYFDFFIKEKVIDIASDSEGNILLYHLTEGMDYVLTLYNAKGEVLKRLFAPEEISYKRFIFRFKNGSVRYSINRDRFFFLYPDSFDIYEISTKGELVDTLSYTGISEFSNEVTEMPGNLNPYDMTDKHWKYWASFNHPHQFYLVGDDHILFENVSLEVDETPTWTIYYNLIP